MTEQILFDALMPGEMATKAENIGVKKAALPAMKMFALAILAGAFISMGAIFATVVATGASGILSFGVTKLLVGLVFCLGLILVVVAGSELFTGNNLIVMAWANGKVSTSALLRNWGIVYLGNFVGSVATALVIFFSKQYTFAGGGVGTTALNIANGKVDLGFVQAIALGIMCNALVCMAVWMTFSARDTAGKIAAIIFPITAFVAGGFEHCVANMYFIPIGLFIKDFDPVFTASTGLDLSGLTWGTFLINNLLPVTIGNIIGGSLFVAGVYWFIYLRKTDK
ncbi:MAG: formate transporter FocA [Anaerolineales bacterium]|nr:formate transporter FocA [Anaerolineales bacterium]